MKNQVIILLENKLHGFHTRLKELHYSSHGVSIHKILDEFDEKLQAFDDSLMEESQALFGFIEPGELSPVLPQALEPLGLLQELRGVLAEFYEGLSGGAITWIGLKSEIEGFWHTINQTIYLIKVWQRSGQSLS